MSSEALHNNSGSHSESCFQGPERQKEPPTNTYKTLTAGKKGGRRWVSWKADTLCMPDMRYLFMIFLTAERHSVILLMSMRSRSQTLTEVWERTKSIFYAALKVK